MSAYVWQPEITSPGIRLAVKDNIAVAGLPTRAGGTTPIVANEIQTAPVVQTLLDAGYALVGKTKMVELAFGGWGTNATADAPGNPWDSSRVCGGSSSGSAAAVADGCNCVILGHHGCSVVADSVDLAYKRAANLEEAARATLTMLQLGDTTTVCPPSYLATIRAREAAAQAGH